MGKTKTFTEPDPGPFGNFRPASSSASRQRQVSNARPGSRRGESHAPRRSDFGGEIPPVPVLMRLIWVRLRRALLVLRYRANSLTLGAFRQHGLVKVATLLVLGYFTFGGGGRSSSLGAGGDEQGISLFGLFKSDDEKVDTKTGKAQKTKYKGKNDAAPVSAGELFEQEAAEYVERFHQIAQTEQQKYGVPASISLAQGLIESRAGTSKLAVSNNNHFGMKCFSRHCKKGHCSNFTDDTHKDFFRKYQNPWESWRAHSEMLSKGRYRSLHKYGTNYKQWAYGLKSIGYATDRSYAEKLIGVIERYNLHRFD